MAKATKYSIKDLKKQFPTDDVALDFIFDALHSRECSCGGTYRRLSGRKQYQCSKCRYQIAPTAGTIFHKSDTPLTDWFYALFIFSNAKSGISAKELERQLGVTYKTAWRILKQIRTALGMDTTKLDGIVEIDTAYFGGRFRSGTYNKRQKEAIAAKSIVMGAVSRRGEVRFKVVPDASASTVKTFLDENVAKTATLITASAASYINAAKEYKRESVDHHKKEYARGGVHLNNMEILWGHLKRSMKGTYKTISRQELQSYLDAFAFHYNNRGNDSHRFGALLGTVLRGVK